MVETLVRDITQFLHTHPHWGIIITFFVAFAESLAIIGTIVPGSVTMTAVGVMVGTGVLPLVTTFIVAILGALGGDYVSYWIGKVYCEQIRSAKYLANKSDWIKKGEAFFAQHGGKSVIIGRFFGPVRSLIPMIAGLLKMPTFKFTLAIIPAAILWAIVYITPGILLGAVSLELPPSAATHFILYGFSIILFAWLSTQVIRLFFNRVWSWCDQVIIKAWQFLRRNKTTCWLSNILADPQDPDNHQQLTLLIMMVCSTLAFCCIWISVMTNGLLTSFNEPIYHLLTSIRTPTLDKVMLSITILAERKVMLTLALIIQVYLLARKKFRAAAHWFMLLVLGIGAALGIKYLYYNPRPNVLLSGLSSSSFPSGHVSLITLIIGFCAVLISHEMVGELKKMPYRITAMLLALVAFSRLYLGAHWLTDVIAAFMLAITVILFVTISYRRNLIQHITPYRLATVLLSSWLVIALVIGGKQFSWLQHNYARPQVSLKMQVNNWWQEDNHNVPLYRPNRFGNPTEVLNIQWFSDISTIQNHLIRHGWRSLPPETTIKNLLKRAAVQHNGYRLALMPQQYDYQVPALLMIKEFKVLRLWSSNIMFKDTQHSLWLGSLVPMIHHGKKLPQITSMTTIKTLLNADDLTLKIATIPNNANLPDELRSVKQIIKIRERKP